MSIFRDSFTKEVQEQLKVRQEAISNRTPQSIQYMNSRNSWIRMTSSVNVNGSNELAKKYVLLGGTLNESSKLRSGVGKGAEAYSTVTPGGTTNLRGIRPMPGIVSLDIKSKAAYGSLREVTVDFQCWDIRQLEELEVLYMRPGYTVLVEWGWLPYLSTDKDGKTQLITSIPQFYDILDKQSTDRTIIFEELFDKSKKSGGNYDAMFGYIKNYQWTSRMDGGYDCQTTIITTGEIIESLKVNYIRPDINTSATGILNNQISKGVELNKSSKYNQYYSKNILAGLWFESYSLLSNLENFTFIKETPLSKGIRIKNFYTTNTTNTEDPDAIVSNGIQCYLPLDAVIDTINRYVIPDNAAPTTGSILSVSLNKSKIHDDGSDLLCIAHPLQISADPTVCLIKSPLWYGGALISPAEEAAANEQLKKDISSAESAFASLKEGEIGRLGKFFGTSAGFNSFESAFTQITSSNIYSILNGLLAKSGKGNLEQFLKKNLFTDAPSLNFLRKVAPKFNSIAPIDLKLEFSATTQTKIEGNESRVVTYDKLTADSIKITGPVASNTATVASTITQKSKQALAKLDFLKTLPTPYFLNDDPYTEIGITKNIYINLDFLYKLSLNLNLESQDKKEKNEINLYNYLKAIVSAIQTSLGNVNNFEIHVDPVDSIARIIDVNYTGPKVQGKNGTYESLFELQIHNTKSAVRSYNVQSQIFPEQSAIIAIGSQAKGGQLGMQNNTMIDFNRSLIDRIIPEKNLPLTNNLYSKEGASQLNNGLATLIDLFSSFGKKPAVDPNKTTDANVSYSDGKNALRDIIVYFQTITSSPSKNRNLIPIKFSCEMDGIGGMVIGHMFKLPDYVLPKGYRGEKGVGAQLGQAITSIGHTINNSDWVTKIDALNIVLNDDTKYPPFRDLDLNTILANTLSPEGGAAPPPGFETPNANNLEKYLTENKIAAVKSGELNNGGEIEQGIGAISGTILATIKSRYPDISLTVTSGNDTFHQKQAGFSNHQVGKAVDFTISPATTENINKVKSVLNEFKVQQPLFKYLDEYNNPSTNATDKHFHMSFNVLTTGA